MLPDSIETIKFQNSEYYFNICPSCESGFFNPPPSLDYTNHTADSSSIRDYVELNASIDQLAKNILSAIGDRSAGRLLDIGCGFGFAADIARRVSGWDVTAIEPSTYGRYGAEALGLNILPDIIDANHPITKERFDLIFCSEVIEHVSDPLAFARLLQSLLAENGLLVFSTPDVAVLQEPVSEGERLAALSPGAHVFLYSRTAFENLFKVLGFPHTVIRRQGASLVGYASTSPIHLADIDGVRASATYARAVLASNSTHESLRIGMAYRLFRALTEMGAYEEAESIAHLCPAPVVALDRYIESFGDFMTRHKSHDAPLLYYHAMYNLNYKHDFKAAAALFLDGYLLAKVKMRVAPALSTFEETLIGSYLFHHALSKLYLGEVAYAQSMFQHIASGNEKIHMAEYWSSRAKEQAALGADS